MLEIANLTKFYGQNKVLDGLNLNLKQGEIYGLLGSNGAGKTTTINIICGLLKQDSGKVLINGQEINRKTKHYLGIAPQDNLLYSHLNCQENLAFFGKLYGLKNKSLKLAIYQSLKAVNLISKRKETVSNLSGGMQRRLNLAVAIIHHPLLLILDEPTTGLDISARYDLWQLIFHLKEKGISILLTTHLLDEAEKLCDRIGFLQEGKIVKEGNLRELKTLIPAEELIYLKTPEEKKAIYLGEKQSFKHRYYQGELVFLAPQILELSEILNIFSDVKITSITKQAINLQHIYLEINNGFS